ncbi:MAG: glycosyl transferase [Pelagibacterales bacterium]|nr:glycosyl transferase [Pelagibacterales bacterium]|tara:strand:- start:1243 stop:2406 length:1164 start_codon:yes stop_codon:yes gene_type:complete
MTVDIKNYRILQVLPHLNSGGLVSGAIEISNALQKSGHISYVASNGGRREREIIREGGIVLLLPLASKNPITIFRNIYRLSKIIQKNKIDIIHARSRAPAWSAYFAAKKMNIPFITTFHGTYSIKGKWKKKYNSVMTKGDKVIAISNFIKKHILNNYNINHQKVVTIHRGINLDTFNHLEVSDERLISFCKKFNIPEDNFVILLPGRITRWKGHKTLIEAVAMLGREDIVCLFVGDIQGRNKYYNELNSLIDKLGLTNNFRIIENQIDMAAIYKLADVVISASTDPEAFGRVVAEAQAMGRPTVAVNHGGGPEIIINNVTGWLFKSGDAIDLSDKILKAIDLDDLERKNMASKAIERTSLNFNNDTMCFKTLEIYSDLINRNIKNEK